MLSRKKFLYAVCGLLVVSFPSSIFAQGGQQGAQGDQASPIAVAGSINQSAPASAVEETASAALPDSPGAIRSQEQQQQQEQNARQQSESPSETTVPQQTSQPSSIEEVPQSQGAVAPPPASPQAKPQRPVGTAAAEAPMVSGVTAAQPAGFAIAPAKQHRVRTLVIKVGAIAGAAVALGTIMALTMATPSKPPGAH